jgi:hypothetical protein
LGHLLEDVFVGGLEAGEEFLISIKVVLRAAGFGFQQRVRSISREGSQRDAYVRSAFSKTYAKSTMTKLLMRCCAARL